MREGIRKRDRERESGINKTSIQLYPHCEYRWSYDDSRKIFTMSNLNISDAGWYKCLVITNEGRAEADFSLVVLGVYSLCTSLPQSL